MICYFASRRMEILAHASTRLRDGLHIKDDKKVEEIGAGQDVFSGYLCYGGGQRLEAEAAAEVGNYILKKSGSGKDEVYTIIDSESSPIRREVYFYAEAAGLDLIGEVLEPFEAKALMTLREYAAKWLYDTGYEVGADESGGTAKMLAWEDADTSTERILSTAEKFGCEVSYRFEVDRFSVLHKYIDFYKKRGRESDRALRRGRDFEDLRIKKSIADIATALRVTGGTPDGAGIRRASDDTYTWVKFSEYRNGRDEESAASMSDDPDGMQFIGISPGHASDDESEVPEDYLWTMISKKSGIIAVPSAQGHLQTNKVPQTGKALYTWIMFATDENGSNLSDQPTDRSYIGFAYNHTTPNKSTLPSYYTWCPIGGDRMNRDIYINPGAGAVSEGNGLYTWIKFSDSADGSGMSDSRVGKTYIGFAFHQTGASESTNPADYNWQKITIATTNGGFCLFNPSYPGIRQRDGSFLWVRFAADGQGTNMAGVPNGRPYLGIAYDKPSPIQSNDPADYEWTLIDADETQAVTLKGMYYDDGDFWVDSAGRIRSEEALRRWSRYVSPDETGTDVGHIIAEFESDATDQQQLLQEAIAELSRRREPEVTYEIELLRKPDWLNVGDTVPIADPDGNLFLRARLLKVETSEEKGTTTATFGDYVRFSSSLSEQVARLAKKQREAARAPNYQWVVYADTPTGDGIRLDPEGAAYMGVAYNKVSPDPDLTDPFEYSWTRIGGIDGENGADGEDAVTLRIDSTRGLVFKNNWYDTQLRVTVVKGGTSITDLQALRQEFGAGAYLQWYFRRQADDAWSVMNVSDQRITEGGFCLTVTPDDVDEQITFQCDLEA